MSHIFQCIFLERFRRALTRTEDLREVWILKRAELAIRE